MRAREFFTRVSASIRFPRDLQWFASHRSDDLSSVTVQVNESGIWENRFQFSRHRKQPIVGFKKDVFPSEKENFSSSGVGNESLEMIDSKIIQRRIFLVETGTNLVGLHQLHDVGRTAASMVLTKVPETRCRSVTS